MILTYIRQALAKDAVPADRIEKIEQPHKYPQEVYEVEQDMIRRMRRQDYERLSRSAEDARERRSETESRLEQPKTSYETQLAGLRIEKDRVIDQYSKKLQHALEKADIAQRQLEHVQEMAKLQPLADTNSAEVLLKASQARSNSSHVVI